MNVTATTNRLRVISRNFLVLIDSTRDEAVALHLELADLSADSDICVREMSRWFLFHADKCVSCKPMRTAKNWFAIVVMALCSACSSGNENAHTTATTSVSPPAPQVLKAEFRPGPQVPAKPDDPKLQVDPQ